MQDDANQRKSQYWTTNWSGVTAPGTPGPELAGSTMEFGCWIEEMSSPVIRVLFSSA